MITTLGWATQATLMDKCARLVYGLKRGGQGKTSEMSREKPESNEMSKTDEMSEMDEMNEMSRRDGMSM